MHICICIDVCVYTYVYICIHMYTYVYIYIYIYTHIHVYIYICIYDSPVEAVLAGVLPPVGPHVLARAVDDGVLSLLSFISQLGAGMLRCIYITYYIGVLVRLHYTIFVV